jgi:hypothetical protein
MSMVLDYRRAQMLCMFKLITHHLQFIMRLTGFKSKVCFHLENYTTRQAQTTSVSFLEE